MRGAKLIKAPDTFKRWFDAGDAEKVKNVFANMVSTDQTINPVPPDLIPRITLEQADWLGRCAATDRIVNAYMSFVSGRFHLCPVGIARPNAVEVSCSQLDGYSSAKIRTVAGIMIHEFTHWDTIGSAAIGQSIVDKARGASDCFNLSPGDKLLNAQNYAFLASEAYYQSSGCTFSDPPPGTADDEDDDIIYVSPTTYTGGWCGMHVTQYQKNEPRDCATCENPEYSIQVSIYDANQVLLNAFEGTGVAGISVALNGVPQIIETALPNLMYVTVGAVDDDPLFFTYGDQDWGSNDQAHGSNWGSYDDGKRDGDTGFSC